MESRDWLLKQIRKLWSLASEVIDHEVDFKWLGSIYEDDTHRDEEKTRQARVRFLKFNFEVFKQEIIVKKLIDEQKDGNRAEREDKASGDSSDSKGDDV